MSRAKPMPRPWYSDDYTSEPTRELTAEEKQFVEQARAGYFGVQYAADGHPFAMGAVRAANLFDMEVDEIEDRGNGGSIYCLPQRDGEVRS
jgi:fido (protein-threonine AMPylation protein)